MPTIREERKKQVTERRRGQILEAALAVFSRQGYDRAAMHEIAAEAGIAVGTIYNYYPAKRDILFALYNLYIFEPFQVALSDTDTLDDTGFVTALMQNRLEFGRENADRFIPLMMEVQRDPALRRHFKEELLKPVMKLAETFVSSRIERGDFHDINPAVITHAIGGMVVGFMLLSRIEGEDSLLHTMEPGQMAGDLARFVLKGIKK